MSKELADTLKVISEWTPKLRQSGVVGPVKAGDVEFSVGAPIIEDDKQAAAEDSDGDPLNNPVTYGLPPGTKLPSFRSKQ